MEAIGSTTLTLSNLQLSSGGDYFYRLTPMSASDGPEVDSNRATVIIYSVDTELADITLPLGEDRVFTVTVQSSPSLTYQWFVNSDLLSNNLPRISGVSTNELTINAIGAADEGAYSLEITGMGTTLTFTVASFQVSVFVCKSLAFCFSIIT